MPFETAPLKEVSITGEVALLTNGFRAHHRDPADAFLAATAKVKKAKSRRVTSVRSKTAERHRLRDPNRPAFFSPISAGSG